MISQNQYLGGESHVLKHISAFCDENFVRESERRRGGEGEGGRGSIRGYQSTLSLMRRLDPVDRVD